LFGWLTLPLCLLPVFLAPPPTRPDPVEIESFAQRVSPLLRSKRAFLRRG